MSKQFDQLLDQLADRELPVPIDRLSELSDLDKARSEALRGRWSSIPAAKRRSIIIELGNLAEENILLTFEAVNRIALDDQDPDVKCNAISNLWECEDPSLITIFTGLLRSDPVSEVRAAAAKALGAFLFLAEIDTLSAETGLEIEEALLQAIRHTQETNLYCSCLESLGYSSRPEVQDLISQAYQSKDEPRVRAALLAMGRSANRQWEERILSSLSSPSPQIRYEAAAAAGELEIQDAVLELIDLLEDVNRQVKHAALWSLSQLGGARATEVIIAFADQVEDDDEAQLREDAIDNATFVNGTREMFIFDFDDPEDALP